MRSITVLILILTTACGAIFNDKTKTVMIQSQTPGHQILVNGAPSGVTPSSITINNNESSTVTIQGASGESYACRFESSVGVGYVVLDVLFTGLIGIIVDAATGRWSSVESTGCMAPF